MKDTPFKMVTVNVHGYHQLAGHDNESTVWVETLVTRGTVPVHARVIRLLGTTAVNELGLACTVKNSISQAIVYGATAGFRVKSAGSMVVLFCWVQGLVRYQ